MRFSELEDRVYGHLRRMDTLAATTELNRNLSQLPFNERMAGLHLKAYVSWQCGPRYLGDCLRSIDAVLGDERTALITRFKSNLLGAAVAQMLGDHARWTLHNEALIAAVPELPLWEGRVIRSEAHGLDVFGTPQEAIGRFSDSVKWHLANTGPFDERDRLCYLAVSYANLCRLYLRVGDFKAALAVQESAEECMPSDTHQTVHIYMSRASYHLAVGEADPAREAIAKADLLLSDRPNHAISVSLGELKAQLFVLTGETIRAQAMLHWVSKQAALFRNLALLKRVQAVTISGAEV